VKPDRLPAWEEVIPLLQMAADTSVPLEVCVLKFHLVVEVQMYRVLALRLNVDEQYLPALQYFPLARLALAGADLSPICAKVLALNDLRNAFSHEISSDHLIRAYAAFVRKANMFWPETDVLGKPQAFEDIRDMAVRWSAYSCITDVLSVFSDFAISQPDFDGDIDEARNVIAHIKETVETTRKKQAELRELFEKTK
jgi:hypothetical protein